MGHITKIRHTKQKQRYYIDIDGQYALSIRERIFPAFSLFVGKEVNEEELKEKEKFFWKKQYQNFWKEEKKRLAIVQRFLTHCDNSIKVEITGFGADSTELILEHPDNSGEPDLSVKDDKENVLVNIEVTGTKKLPNNSNIFWIRPDKIEWAKNNPEKEYWVALHYEEPRERLRFFKPDLEKDYKTEKKLIRGVEEIFVCLTEEDTVGARDFVKIFQDTIKIKKEELDSPSGSVNCL